MRVLVLAVLLASSAAAQTTPAETVAAWPDMTEEERFDAVRAVFVGESAGSTLADDPAAYVPVLSLALDADHAPTRGVALTLLSFGGIGISRGMIAEGTFDALWPGVLRATRAGDARERAAAYSALLAFDGPETVAAVVAGVRDPAPRAAGAALGVIYVLGTTVREAALPVVLAAQGGRESMAGAAVLALGALFRDADALPADVEGALRAALTSGRPYVQQEALRAVSDVGPGATGLRREVEALAAAPPEDWDHLGPNAEAALRRIDGAPSTRDPALR